MSRLYKGHFQTKDTMSQVPKSTGTEDGKDHIRMGEVISVVTGNRKNGSARHHSPKNIE